MAKTRHKLTYTSKLIRELDYIMPRIKYSVSYRMVTRWLENFEEKDVEQALDVLYFLEYIDFHELNYRLDVHLREVLKLIPIDHTVVVYPSIVEYPKSTELINYIIKDNLAFKARSNRLITRDISKIDLTKPTAFILTDDFIGSGSSFKKGYDTKSTLKSTMDDHNITQRYLLSAICMREGEQYIHKHYPEIHICSTFREKAFDKGSSVFNIAGNREKLMDFCKKYGEDICTENYPPYSKAPFGYDSSESNIAFDHTTPNNTLPIFWSSSKWFPLFPRYSKDKISKAKETKKEIAYYLGIMNRLKLDLFESETVVFTGIKKRTLKYNNLEDHGLVTILKLMIDGHSEPVICQILGLMTVEYQDIIKKGLTKKLIDPRGTITPAGRDFFKNLIKKAGNRKFLVKHKDNFELKFVNYVPESFMGKT